MNNTIFAVVAIMAAAALLAGALVIAPAAYAGGGGGDGNTVTKESNKAKSIASGFGTIAANVQANAVCALVVTLCI
jgi:hypothetical protein